MEKAAKSSNIPVGLHANRVWLMRQPLPATPLFCWVGPFEGADCLQEWHHQLAGSRTTGAEDQCSRADRPQPDGVR